MIKVQSFFGETPMARYVLQIYLAETRKDDNLVEYCIENGSALPVHFLPMRLH